MGPTLRKAGTSITMEMTPQDCPLATPKKRVSHEEEFLKVTKTLKSTPESLLISQIGARRPPFTPSVYERPCFEHAHFRNISQTLRWYALRSWRQRPSARQHKVGELTPQKRPVLALTRNTLTRRSANAGPRFDHFLAPRGPHRRGVGAAGFGAGRDPRGAHCRNSVNDALRSSTDVVAENAARPRGWCPQNRKPCASPTLLRYDLKRDAPWMGGWFALQKAAPTFSSNTLFSRAV